MVKCLNCGYRQEVTKDKVFNDEWGPFIVCEKCTGSFDVELVDIVEENKTDLADWVVRLDFDVVTLSVYFYGMPENMEEEELYEMALEKAEKDGWKLPEDNYSWEAEII